MLNKSFTQMAIFIRLSSLHEFKATCVFHFLFLGRFESYSLICNRHMLMAELRLSPKSWKRTSACFLTSLSTLIVTFMLFISKISNDIESQKDDVLKLTHIQNMSNVML